MMAVTWSSPDSANRFDPYVEELQDFFASYGIHYGSAQDIVSVMELLNTPGPFADDLSTMVRAIILRHGGTMPRADLLEIVAVAIGGPHIDQAAQELQPPVHKLLGFLNGVLRKPWSQHSGEDTPKPLEFDAARVAPAFIRPESVFSRLGHVHPGPEILTPAPDSPPSIPASDPQPSASAPTPTVVRVADPGQKFASAPVPVAKSNSAAFPVPPLTIRSMQAARWISGPKRTAVIAGSGAILLGALLGVFHHPHSVVRVVSGHPATTSYAAATAVPTPVPKTNSTPTAAPASTPTPIPKINPTSTASESVPTRRPARTNRSEEIIAAPYSTPIPVEPTRSRSNGVERPVSDPRPGSGANSSVPSAARSAAPIERRSASVKPPPENEAVSAANVESPRDVDGRSSSANYSRSSSEGGRYPMISYGVMAGHLISAPHPSYPLVARIAHIKGQVTLQAVIAKNGSVSSTHVLSGHRLLHGAAIDAVRQWRFRPYLVEGRPTDVSTIVTVDFDNAQ